MLVRLIAADPIAADAAQFALDRNRPRAEAPIREHEPTAYDLIAGLRHIHYTIDRVAAAVSGGHVTITAEMTEAVTAEVDWLQNASDLIKSGVQSGSFDDQLARLVEEG